MKRTFQSVIFATAFAFAPGAYAELADMPSGAYVLDKNHAYISFSYNHLGYSTPHIGFRSFDVALELDSANVENSKVSVTIDATSVDSRVEVFNGHLQGENFFDTAKYPEITFESTGIKSTGDNTFDLMGDLTIKGNTLPVTLAATLQKADFHPMRKLPTVGVTAETTVSRSAFGMPRGTPNISDEVTIMISVELPQMQED